MAMAKNGKKGPVKTGLGGQSREIGRGGSGAAGGSYGPTAGRGNLGKGVVNKLRQSGAKTNVTPKTIDLMKKSGAISSGPSTAEAIKSATKRLNSLGYGSKTLTQAQTTKLHNQLVALIKKYETK
jgi:hypothetical protein